MRRTIQLRPAGSPVRSRPDQICVTPHRGHTRGMEAGYRTLDREVRERLAARGWSVASPFARWRALRDSAFEVFREVNGEANPVDPGGPGDPVEITVRLRGGVETLLRIDADLESLLGDESERVRELARVTIGYRRRLEAGRLVDPAESLWHVARLEQPRRPLLIQCNFREHLQPRIDELALIDALAGDGSEIWLSGGEESNVAGNAGNMEAVDFLRQRGWAICADAPAEQDVLNPNGPNEFIGVNGDAWRIGDAITRGFVTGEVAEGIVRLWSYPTIDAEIRGVLAAVKQLLTSGVGPEDIVLVTNDEAVYGPVLLATGWEYELPVRLLYDIPLGESRFGSWVRLMLESIAGGFAFEPTLQFLAHSLSPGLDAKVLARSLQTLLPNQANRRSWEEAGVDLAHLDWPEEDTRSRMIERLRAAMKGTRLPLQAPDLLAQERLDEGLRELAGENGGRARITISGMAREVGELLRLLKIPAQAEPERELGPANGDKGSPGDHAAIELHQPEYLSGSRYRHVFVLGMIEGMMPRPVIEDPVLDLHDRKRLRGRGLRFESAADLARREMHGFCLVAGAAMESLNFSFPRLKGGKPTIPSAYLERLGLSALPGEEQRITRFGRIGPMSLEEWRISHLADGTESSADPVLEQSRHAYRVELRREMATDYDEYDGLVGDSIDPEARVWSASQMTRLGQCPFQWFSRYVLGIADPEELPGEISSRQIGKLFHRALELALANLPVDGSGSNPREHALARIDDALRQAESDPENPFPKYPAWSAQRKEYLASLRRAISAPEFIRPDAVVIGRETKFEGVWEGLRVVGFIDRIDRTPESIELIDYKTSSRFPNGAQDDSGYLKVDLQIPIYTESAGASLFPGEEVSGRYYSLNKGQNLKEPGSWAGEEQRRRFATGLRERLRSGRFPVEPDVEGKACTYCEFDPICRKGPRLERKNGHQERMWGE
jgi:RecB family exonuclease